MHSVLCQCCKSMPMHVYCSSACALRWQCEPASPCKPDGGFVRAAATARNVSRTASGGHAALANEFVALSVQARPQAPRAALARQPKKRGPRSEAWHTSVWLRFGVATLARRRALRERMPCSLFSTLSGRDSRIEFADPPRYPRSQPVVPAP